jgi:hypothetical protein
MTNMRTEVLPHILAALERNRRQLDEMRQKGDVNGTAWVSRNILELVVWAKYCRRSDENAYEFLQDVARDSMDAMNIPDEMVKPEGREGFRAAREAMLANAAEDHIKGRYKSVSDAAKQIGFDLFGKYNMFLSKWVHPTAVSMFAPVSSNWSTSGVADCLYWISARPGDQEIIEIRGFLGL